MEDLHWRPQPEVPHRGTGVRQALEGDIGSPLDTGGGGGGPEAAHHRAIDSLHPHPWHHLPQAAGKQQQQ